MEICPPGAAVVQAHGRTDVTGYWRFSRQCERGQTRSCTNKPHYRLKKSNKMQLYVDIYLLLNYSTCFGRPSYPSSGVHKTVVAASGTDHTGKYKS